MWWVFLAGIVLLVVCVPASGKDAKQIVQQAVRTELAADASDNTHWLF